MTDSDSIARWGVDLLQHVKVRRDELPGLFTLSLPLFSRRTAAAERERTELLAQWLGRYPHGALWLSNLYDEQGWSWPADIPARLRELNEGVWYLLLFDAPPANALPAVEDIPCNPPGLLEFTRQQGARIGIYSDYDDVDWLVALHDSTTP